MKAIFIWLGWRAIGLSSATSCAREIGVVRAGPDPQTLIDPVQPADLQRAVLEVLGEWWAPMLQNPARLNSPGYTPYAALTMCRALYTLQFGAFVTKRAPARWAQEALEQRWAELIERALAWPRDAEEIGLNEALDFIRHTLERSRE